VSSSCNFSLVHITRWELQSKHHDLWVPSTFCTMPGQSQSPPQNSGCLPLNLSKYVCNFKRKLVNIYFTWIFLSRKCQERNLSETMRWCGKWNKWTVSITYNNIHFFKTKISIYIQELEKKPKENNTCSGGTTIFITYTKKKS